MGIDQELIVAENPPLVRPQLWLHPEGLVAPGAVRGGDPDGRALLSARELAWSRSLPPSLADRYRRSRQLLRWHVAQVLACDPAVVPLHSPPGAPPLLGAGAGWVSLSHSGQALLLAWSSAPIGVDLEAGGRALAAAALLQRFFPRQEQAYLAGWAPEQLRQAVLLSWVHKEAAIKARHGSLADDLRHWCFDHHTGGLRHLIDGARPESAAGLWGGWQWAAVGPGCGQVRFQAVPASAG